MRALASCGIVEETQPGLFATTTLGDALRDGAPGTARATILTIAGSWQWKAWDQFLYALRTGQSCVQAAFRTCSNFSPTSRFTAPVLMCNGWHARRRRPHRRRERAYTSPIWYTP
jgi:Protein of unknown function (DUF3604)